MNAPDLTKVFETFIEVVDGDVLGTLRARLLPWRAFLDKETTWFCFLIHNKDEGAYFEKGKKVYIHLRMCIKGRLLAKVLPKVLPAYCVHTRKVPKDSLTEIFCNVARKKALVPTAMPIKTEALSTSSLRSERIEEFWRAIGEESRFVLEWLGTLKPDVEFPFEQLSLLHHYFLNMTGQFPDALMT